MRCFSTGNDRAKGCFFRAQACLYTLRDLEEDLSRGLVNIPEDVVTLARSQ